MNNLLNSTQIREAEQFTIGNEPITSIDLMERAAEAFVNLFKSCYPDQLMVISVLCGQGNNGGDGLAIARLLYRAGYKYISVSLINLQLKQSKDYTENLERLRQTKVPFIAITEPEQLENDKAALIIDAILGSGLNKPLNDNYVDLVHRVNNSGKTIVSVDVPTGFPSEGVLDADYKGIKADLVICFQQPKLNFFFPESAAALTEFKVVNIGLNQEFIDKQPSNWKLITPPSLKTRANFTHKGTYGHALIVAGDKNTMGAALLSARACLRVGAGLTTLCLPECGYTAVHAALPEVMTLLNNAPLSDHIVEKMTAIAIGPGIGLGDSSEALLEQLIKSQKTMVIDADALSILAKRNDLFKKLRARTILTPHVKEFDRLFGTHQSWWERIETARKQAQNRNLIIVLKNQYTFVCMPNGEVHINQTGNAAMASGGMGDVLTGMIVGFLAQSYTGEEATQIAVYLHGKAGDELAAKRFTVSASQVADQLPKTIKKVISHPSLPFFP